MIPAPKVRPFTAFLLSYLLVLSLPLSVGLVAYFDVLRTVERGERDSNRALLAKTANALDARIRDVDRMTLILGNDAMVRRFALEGPVRDGDTYALSELLRHLSLFRDSLEYVQSYYIYFRNSGRIVSRDTAFVLPSFYEDHYRFGALDYPAWRDLFLVRRHASDMLPADDVVMEAASARLVTRIRSFPAVPGDNPTIVVWAHLDAARIGSELQDVARGGWSWVLDAESRLVAASAPTAPLDAADALRAASAEGSTDRTVGGMRVILSSVRSELTGWTWLSAVPFQLVIARTRSARLLLGSVGLVMIGLGIALAYLLSLRSVKPLRDLMEANTALSREAQRQLPLLRASVFDRLLRGEYTEEAEISAVLRQLAWDVPGDLFCVVRARIGAHRSMDWRETMAGLLAAKSAARAVIERRFPGRMHAHDRGEEELVLLIGLREGEAVRYRAAVEADLKVLYEELQRAYRVEVLFAGSGAHRGLREVWRAYGESVGIADSIRVNAGFKVAWHDDSRGDGGAYYFPLDVETRLSNNARAGNRAEAEGILELVRRENMDRRKTALDPQMARALAADMGSTLVKVLESRALPDSDRDLMRRAADLHAAETLDGAFGEARSILGRICSLVDERKKSHRSDLMRDIRAHIEERYADPGLNRYGVATRFHMSEEYFSTFFKEQTGIYFSDFLEGLRMSRACQLLSDGSAAIGDVARGVGYSSTASFGRAFRRAHGVNPSEYRASGPRP